MAGIGVAVVALGLLAAAGVLAYRWGRALGELQKGVVALGTGRAGRPVLRRLRGPVGGLARALDETAAALQSRITQLEQDRQQLRAVLSGMSEGVVAVDARRRLLFANASADKLFGLAPGSVGRLVP